MIDIEIRTSEDVRDSKRSWTDFMYCGKFTLRPARNLVKEFHVVVTAIHLWPCLHCNLAEYNHAINKSEVYLASKFLAVSLLASH